ncbi:3-phosphoserine/phosphohydroxythreonine transaminase [Limnobacter litoralis]|uniref:Phosphoserine aminotransferase n=1 Tax=Limnobacter litoralis TaxID=481366 RepID=A0ABQ5YPT1_9BURK|nr:3-phosphoserine/phosphohydroxythreonine transaminase [Limnobacter litoralis]GLR26589.1 phosphoserine aminotransferase [Limnobacter litoralis]
MIAIDQTLHANQLNFSGGPGALPQAVLDEVQQSIQCVPETGLSILGISHRSDWFEQVVFELERNVLSLMGLGSDYKVLLLQGGATQQFTMVPMNFLGRHDGAHADYLDTGYWSAKALPDARIQGDIRVAWSGRSENYARLPEDHELLLSPSASYLHYCSNETVEGLQFNRVIGLPGVRRVCDMSSDFLSRPGQYDQFDLMYAHAQKNLGPSGVTLVVIKRELLEQVPKGLPSFLDYREQARANSILNTPPVFAIYVVLLATQWIRQTIGGLDAMGEINQSKAACLYRVIDQSDGFYRCRVAHDDRSIMNVAFSLPDPGLQAHFLAESALLGFSGLAGHRSVGGLRASLYNGLELAAAEHLAEFMSDFAQRNG